MLEKRASRTGANDLHTIYRPYRVDEVLGHKTNMAQIKTGLDSGTLPHANLFIGDAGCGKTTAARIIALGLNCLEYSEATSTPCLKCESCSSILNYNSIDVIEVNVAQAGNKADIDSIARDLPGAPFTSRYKVIIFDEAHKLSDAAQALLLKVIEDGYRHVYFVFCTNLPEKLKSAFLTRCSVMRFGPLQKNLILDLLTHVCEFEGISLKGNDKVKPILEYVATECKGVPRTALVWLQQIKDEGSWNLEVVSGMIGGLAGINDPNLLDICRATIKGSFKDAVVAFEKIRDKDDNIEAESLRIGMLGYFVACLKNARSTYVDQRKFSKVIDTLAMPVGKGTLGDYYLYNYIFKAAGIMAGKE